MMFTLGVGGTSNALSFYSAPSWGYAAHCPDSSLMGFGTAALGPAEERRASESHAHATACRVPTRGTGRRFDTCQPVWPFVELQCNQGLHSASDELQLHHMHRILLWCYISYCFAFGEHPDSHAKLRHLLKPRAVHHQDFLKIQSKAAGSLT